jgi:hypothetical protein
MKLTFENITNLRDLNNKLLPLLDDLCERYFEENEPDWMFYNDWEFGEDNNIYLNYSYHDYSNEQSECGYTIVDIQTLLDFEKQCATK